MMLFPDTLTECPVHPRKVLEVRAFGYLRCIHLDGRVLVESCDELNGGYNHIWFEYEKGEHILSVPHGVKDFETLRGEAWERGEEMLRAP